MGRRPDITLKEGEDIMGIDLTLMPLEADLETVRFSHTLLEMDRDYDLWEKIRNLERLPLHEPETVYTYLGDGKRTGNTGTEKNSTGEDCYGHPWHTATAGDLSRAGHGIVPQLSDRNRAGLVYLQQLDPDTKVILHWH